MSPDRRPLLVGVGNLDRGDDAAGLLVARGVRESAADAIRVLEFGGDQIELIDTWEGAERVIVVDAVSSGAEPGTVYCFEGRGTLPAGLRQLGTHGFGIVEAVELAAALGRLPGTLTVFGIEGPNFRLGRPLTPEVARAIEGLVTRILKDLNGPIDAGMHSGRARRLRAMQ